LRTLLVVCLLHVGMSGQTAIVINTHDMRVSYNCTYYDKESHDWELSLVCIDDAAPVLSAPLPDRISELPIDLTLPKCDGPMEEGIPDRTWIVVIQDGWKWCLDANRGVWQ
jgi:hypothetical protein